jgi:hypothetical protein
VIETISTFGTGKRSTTLYGDPLPKNHPTHADLTSLLSNPELNAVIVATPNKRHIFNLQCLIQCGNGIWTKNDLTSTVDYPNICDSDYRSYKKAEA